MPMHMREHIVFSPCNSLHLQQKLPEVRSLLTCAPGLVVHGLGSKPQLADLQPQEYLIAPGRTMQVQETGMQR